MRRDVGGAIIAPIISVWATKALMILIFGLIALLTLFIPAECSGGGVETVWFNLALSIPDVRGMALESKYPCTLAVSYSSGIILAGFMAIVFALTNFPMGTFEKLYSASLARRLSLLIFSIVILVLPVVHNLPVSSGHRTYLFFREVAMNKTFIFIWSAAVCGIGFLAWVAVLVEITRIFKGIK